MKPDFRNNKDFWAGAMFIVGGVAAMIAARNYPFGTTLRMGPGYFPTLLGGILVAFGIYVMIRDLRSGEKIRGNWSIRALIILPLSMVLFGILMRYAGFIPALAVLVFGAALGQGVQVWRGFTGRRFADLPFGGGVHLGPRSALSAVQGVLTGKGSWSCSAT